MLSRAKVVQRCDRLLSRKYTLISSSIYLPPGQIEALALPIDVPSASREAATRVWLILWKAFQAVEQNARRSVLSLGLGQSDFAVLEVLMHKGPQPVNVIGKKVQLTSGSITAAVDRLESRKLLRRTAGQKDRRSRIVQLTEKGQHLIERAFQKHAADMEETMAVLRSRERVELVRLLKKVGMWAAARLDDYT
jgi:MarR family transcriptional regulator, 2-MHQ and catechol-resistance regulon repressor